MSTTVKYKTLDTNAKPTMNQGKVNFFCNNHKFGFIRLNESREDFFVHMNHILDAIKEADNVIFDIEKGIKGLIAVNVRLA